MGRIGGESLTSAIMAFSLLRHLGKPAPLVFRRTLVTSAAQLNKNPDAPPSVVEPEEKAHFYPRIGDREIVGYGMNGMADYFDNKEYPFPAIRFKETAGDLLALREKEKGSWADLSVEEKKQLYRGSYCRTFSEFTHPTGEWKSIIAMILACFTITGLYMAFCQKTIYLPIRTNTEERHAAAVVTAIAEHTGPIHGLSSLYDYEKKQWK